MNTLLSETMETIPGCIAIGVINLDDGGVAASATTASYEESLLRKVSATTANYFRKNPVDEVREAFSEAGDTQPLAELQIMGGAYFHTFLRYGARILVVVTDNTANIGLVLAKTKILIVTLKQA